MCDLPLNYELNSINVILQTHITFHNLNDGNLITTKITVQFTIN